MPYSCDARAGCYNYTNFTCAACGCHHCEQHSALLPWRCYQVRGGWKERLRRICDDCWEQEPGAHDAIAQAESYSLSASECRRYPFRRHQ